MMWTAHIFLAVAISSGMVFANAEDTADYSEYYKNYYETHSAQERQPAFSRQDLFTNLATPETAVCIFIVIQMLFDSISQILDSIMYIKIIYDYLIHSSLLVVLDYFLVSLVLSLTFNRMRILGAYAKR